VALQGAARTAAGGGLAGDGRKGAPVRQFQRRMHGEEEEEAGKFTGGLKRRERRRRRRSGRRRSGGRRSPVSGGGGAVHEWGRAEKRRGVKRGLCPPLYRVYMGRGDDARRWAAGAPATSIKARCATVSVEGKG
jgi:hypothetical protein